MHEKLLLVEQKHGCFEAYQLVCAIYTFLDLYALCIRHMLLFLLDSKHFKLALDMDDIFLCRLSEQLQISDLDIECREDDLLAILNLESEADRFRGRIERQKLGT